jgi:hypothetical protein
MFGSTESLSVELVASHLFECNKKMLYVLLFILLYMYTVHF